MTLKFSLMVLVMEKYEFSFWGFMMIYMAFFIKMPIYLFHIWLPKAYVEAPVYGSMILAGVLLKMGSYGVIRFMEMFYSISLRYSWVIFSSSIVGSIIVSVLCLVQIDMKSMVAYSSVVHMNLMLCSLMTFLKSALVGAYLMMIAHGLCSSGMFYLVNLYYERSGSRLSVLGSISMHVSSYMYSDTFCVSNLYLSCIQIRVFVFVSS